MFKEQYSGGALEHLSEHASVMIKQCIYVLDLWIEPPRSSPLLEIQIVVEPMYSQ